MEETAVLAALAPRLHQFVAVARSEHMTRAADEIEVPQSTISRGIARLEDDLGVALFVRAGRTVRLTREGRILLRYAERALAELMAADREIRGDADELHGRVGLAFLSALGAAVVPRLLRDFRATHPGVRFDLVQGGHALLLDRLRAGDVDLALTSPLPDESGLEPSRSRRRSCCSTVPADHPLAVYTDGVALADAAREPFLAILPGFGLRGTVDAWCRQAGFVPAARVRGRGRRDAARTRRRGPRRRAAATGGASDGRAWSSCTSQPRAPPARSAWCG